MSLSNKIKTTALAIALAVAGVGAFGQTSYAKDCTCQTDADGKITYAATCTEAEKGMALAGGCTAATPLEDTAKNIINAVLYVVGILAVVMVIIGGIQYTTSAGDQAAVTKAKNTILYGIVGLVIAILAYAIVNFVIGKISG